MAESRSFAADYSGAQTDTVLVSTTLLGSRSAQVRAVVLTNDATAKTVVFKSKPAGASSAVSCTFLLPANGQLVLNPLEGGLGWFASKTNEALTMTTTGAGALGLVCVFALI